VSPNDDDQATGSPGDDTYAFSSDWSSDIDDAEAQQDPVGITGIPPGAALLVVRRGPNAGSRFLLDQPVTTVGRHASSDIFLDDATVSRRHAEFRRREAAFELVDTGSLNGTYVNRGRVDSTVLVHMDEIQLGKFRLVYLDAWAHRTR
jgi:pSer/pThr/pTyr-binding forkhead associated (FHA) protein